MAGEWSIEGEARGLCGCHACSGMGTPEERCVRALLDAVFAPWGAAPP